MPNSPSPQPTASTGTIAPRRTFEHMSEAEKSRNQMRAATAMKSANPGILVMATMLGHSQEQINTFILKTLQRDKKIPQFDTPPSPKTTEKLIVEYGASLKPRPSPISLPPPQKIEAHQNSPTSHSPSLSESSVFSSTPGSPNPHSLPPSPRIGELSSIAHEGRSKVRSLSADYGKLPFQYPWKQEADLAPLQSAKRSGKRKASEDLELPNAKRQSGVRSATRGL